MQKRKIILLILLLLAVSNLCTVAQTMDLTICPLCNKEGTITCPLGFQAYCLSSDKNKTEPKCIFLENKYVSGCWEFVGVNKLNIDFSGLMLTPTAMVEVIGGGETYTLNREIIRCKKL